MNTRRPRTLISTHTEIQAMIIATRSLFVGRTIMNTPTKRQFTIMRIGLIFTTGILMIDGRSNRDGPTWLFVSRRGLSFAMSSLKPFATLRLVPRRCPILGRHPLFHAYECDSVV